jgi:hypothetical protein
MTTDLLGHMSAWRQLYPYEYNFPMASLIVPPKETNHSQKNADRTNKIVKLNKNLGAIILFELIDVTRFEKPKTELAKKLQKVINSITGGKPQSLELDTISFRNYKVKINIFGRYNYGEYVELIFLCSLTAKKQKENDENLESSRRLPPSEEMQREIEFLIPSIMHGLHFKNELNAVKPFRLPALYVYHANIFLLELQGREEEINTIRLDPSPTYTARGRAQSFVDSFQSEWDKPESNSLNTIGIFPESLLGLIDSQVLISYDVNHYFNYLNSIFPCKYVALYFQNIPLVDNDKFLNFLSEFSLAPHIDTVYSELKIILEGIGVPIISGGLQELGLKKQKVKAYSLEANLVQIEDLLHNYYIHDVKRLEHGRNLFSEEETLTYLSGKSFKEYSLSDHFRDRIIENKSDVNDSLSHRMRRLRSNIRLIQSELQLVKGRPMINSFLKDIEDELEIQIKKWDGKIEKQIIEDWILNFDSSNDRLLALKILNKVGYVTNKDLMSLCRALYDRIKPICNISPGYTFSHIGGLTGGSAHILKPFQEENSIQENLFVDIQSIPKLADTKSIFLLDDFVGSGYTFVKWFKNNLQTKTHNIERVYYCVLTAFDKGIEHIRNQTGVQVICPQVYNKSWMVIDGDIFNSVEKTKIKSLVKKYSNRLPEQYLYGYDNCQLLIAFESNIPNNSISLLWASEYWSPLFKRK